MNTIKQFLRGLAPAPLISLYHLLITFTAALWYGFPSRRMTVIGVTGTKGKTTTCNLIAHILTAGGFKVGLATTVNFRIGDKEWVNDTKQTMLGRFALQKLLRQMADAGCTHAVVETSSEGILQHRHRFIDYRVAVFTNLSPEHIERHGSFEAYREAKVRLSAQVARRKDSIGVYNINDPNVAYFLLPKVARQIGYTVEGSETEASDIEIIEATNISLKPDGTSFTLSSLPITTPLIGEGNLYNTLAAIAVAHALGVPEEKIAGALKTPPQVPGRMEIVRKGQPFTIIVDYAHEPRSLEEAYLAAKLFHPKRMIGILGSQGGGRDTWKRSAMGKIAAEYLDTIIFTNEDPYDEDPMDIVADIEKGVRESGTANKPETYTIIDRRAAIRKAISLADPGDAVILTGKGGEVWMCVKNGKKIRWDEKRIVEEVLEGE